MTREEAIEALKARCHYCEHFPKCVNDKPECFRATEMAIRSLEAWDEVMKDVQDWQDDFNTHVKLLTLTDEEKEGTMMYGEDVVNIIGNHMAELKEVEE